MHNETRCVASSPVRLDGYDSLTVPVYRASTIRYPDATSFTSRFERGADGYVYGLYGTPTHRHLEFKITELHDGARTVLAPSGQAAITMSLLAILEQGDRILLPDTAYGPVRDFAVHEARALGILAEFYDPLDTDALAGLLQRKTRLVWVESPGSVTMEMQDVPRIVELSHAAGALVGCDNTWASPLNFQPLAHKADLVVEALSKHMGGHSDILMGSVTVRDEELGLRLKASFGRLGIGVSPDDCVLVLRGIDTLAVRLAYASASALSIAEWLSGHPMVARLLYPALPGDPGHAIWRRDFTGACGVFTFTVDPMLAERIPAALDAFELISIGASWGGTRSLIAPTSVRSQRTAVPWTGAEHLLRISIGLEHPDDIRADLERFFHALAGPVATGGMAMEG
jgi:cysteine-S-conjugate beta-lyase